MRDDSITIAKAIGIILMVVAHAGIPDLFNHFIVMFHMPLFFFVSGYCFKEKYLVDYDTFFKKRIKGLYVPFVKYSLLFLLFHNIFFHLNIYNGEYGFNGQVSKLFSMIDYGKAFVHIVTRMTDNEQLLGGYWFLRELFLASILGYVTIKFVKRTLISVLGLLFLTILFSVTDIKIPYFHIGTLTLLSTFFFVVGHVYKGMNKINSYWINILLFVIVLIGSRTVYTSMLKFNALQVIPYSVCAISGIVLTLNISKFVVEQYSKNSIVRKILIFIGVNTMSILTWHMISFKLVSYSLICYYGLSIKVLASFPVIDMSSKWLWVTYSIIGVCVPLLLSFLFTKIESVCCKKMS